MLEHPQPPSLTNLEKQYLAAADAGNLPEARRLETLIDAEQAATEQRLAAPGAIHGAARWYATTLHLPVFPCIAGGKRPATRHGFHDASTDLGQIDAWWQESPAFNVAAPTGVLFDVFDVDGPEGLIALGDFMDSGGFPDVLALSLTPRGRHYMVPPTGRANTTGLLAKVDYRGTGGYVVLPPSRTPDGSYWWGTPPAPAGEIA